MNRFFAISLLLGILGCNVEQTGGKQEAMAAAYDATFLDAFLRLEFPDSISNGVPLVIERELSIGMLTSGEKKSRFATNLKRLVRHDGRLSEAVSAFCRRNTQTRTIDSIDPLSVKHVIVTGEHGSNLFAAKDETGWKEFFSSHPMTPKRIMLSLPGFSKDGTLAVIYMGAYFSGLAGSGRIYVLEKKEGQWIEVMRGLGPTWVA